MGGWSWRKIPSESQEITLYSWEEQHSAKWHAALSSCIPSFSSASQSRWLTRTRSCCAAVRQQYFKWLRIFLNGFDPMPHHSLVYHSAPHYTTLHRTTAHHIHSTNSTQHHSRHSRAHHSPHTPPRLWVATLNTQVLISTQHLSTDDPFISWSRQVPAGITLPGRRHSNTETHSVCFPE